MSNNFFLADRVKELSRVEGRGNISLDGAVDGFSSFGDFYASGDTVFYAITDNTKYEVGSGMYVPDGSTGRSVTRSVLRSSDVNSGPYFLYGSGAGSHAGQEGYFYPMWLTKSSAVSGVGITGSTKGPYANAHEHVFSGVPGVTFYMPSNHTAHGLSTSAAKTTAATSGSDYASASRPVDFNAGTKEVFITYPGARAVYNAYGIDPDIKEPKESGLAIWKNNQIVSYSPNLIWNDSGNFLGIRNNDPNFAIDIGGLKSFSQVRASGFMDGGSGVLFSGVAGTWSGGRQLEPFLRNRVATTANGVVKLSGTVDEFIGFQNQAPTLVFAGPASDCGCDDAVPTFRALTATDFPLDDPGGLDERYVRQNNDGLGTHSRYPFNIGQVAIYKSSGQITYDSGILYDATNNRLGLGGASVGIIDPAYTLDVSGNMAANSGYFDQLIFTDNIIRIGLNSDPQFAKGHANYQSALIGHKAGQFASGCSYSFLAGHQAGQRTEWASGSIGIGVGAMFKSNSGVNSVFIGTQAGSGDVRSIHNSFIAGVRSSSKTNLVYNSTAIGVDSISGVIEIKDSVAIGQHAMSTVARSSGIVALGYKSMYGGSGIVRTVSAGHRATRGVNTGNDIISIGTDNLEDASGIDNVISIGKEALVRSSGSLHEVTAIGYQAGYHSVRVQDSTFLGRSAGQSASGTFNIYVGHNAGIAVSGHENIEIIASGGNSSILTSSAVGKINIGNTIVGDINAGSIGVGHMTNATPPATLFVQTSGVNDHAMIVRHQGSGSKAPYFALQSGDATTFFQITNSGNVMTSGWLSASGGLHLGDRDPTRASGDGGHVLWNNGGTLIWNGRNVDTAGGTTFKLSPYSTDPTHASAKSVSDGQLVTISGVSGVEVHQNADRFLRISASGLSGVLQDQIDVLSASSYNFFTANIGPGRNQVTQNGPSPASRYNFTRNQLTNIGDEGVIALSGVSGIKVDFVELTGGGYTSGIYTIAYDSNATFTANLIASGENKTNGRNKSRRLLLNGSGLAFKGLKGVDFGFSQEAGNSSLFTLDPSTLSGVLEETIQNSGRYLRNQINLLGMAPGSSGALVSGVAFANHLSIQGITSKSATSGIAISNDKYVMDSGNGGQLSFLRLTDINYDAGSSALSAGSGNIMITDQSGVNKTPRRGTTRNSVFIGSQVAASSSGWVDSVMIGSRAGRNSQAHQGGSGIFIGYRAGEGSNEGDLGTIVDPGRNMYIGTRAGQRGSGNAVFLALGNGAGHEAMKSEQCIGIGSSALTRTSGNRLVNAIGYTAGYMSYNNTQSDFIGWRAGIEATETDASTGLGSMSFNSTSGLLYSVGVGHGAFQEASGKIDLGGSHVPASYNVAIGFQAGKSSHYALNSVFVGRDAGLSTSGVSNSVFLGNNAGQLTSHKNSIILSNKALTLAGTTVYPIEWADYNQDFLLDVGHGIQGILKAGPTSAVAGHSWGSTQDHVTLHIGQPVVKADVDAGTKLQEKTLEIQPTASDQAVLTLDQPGPTGTRTTRTSAGGPLLQTNTDSYQSINTEMGSNLRDGYGGGPRNSTLDIINRHGFPVIPIFNRFIGGELLLGMSPVQHPGPAVGGPQVNNTIPKYPGAFAIGHTNTQSASSTENYVLAICIKAVTTLDVMSTQTGGSQPNSEGLLWKFVKLNEAV